MNEGYVINDDIMQLESDQKAEENQILLADALASKEKYQNTIKQLKATQRSMERRIQELETNQMSRRRGTSQKVFFFSRYSLSYLLGQRRCGVVAK